MSRWLLNCSIPIPSCSERCGSNSMKGGHHSLASSDKRVKHNSPPFCACLVPPSHRTDAGQPSEPLRAKTAMPRGDARVHTEAAHDRRPNYGLRMLRQVFVGGVGGKPVEPAPSNLGNTRATHGPPSATPHFPSVSAGLHDTVRIHGSGRDRCCKRQNMRAVFQAALNVWPAPVQTCRLRPTW